MLIGGDTGRVGFGNGRREYNPGDGEWKVSGAAEGRRQTDTLLGPERTSPVLLSGLFWMVACICAQYRPWWVLVVH